MIRIILTCFFILCAVPAFAQDIFVRPKTQPSTPGPSQQPTVDYGTKAKTPPKKSEPVAPPSATPEASPSPAPVSPPIAMPTQPVTSLPTLPPGSVQTEQLQLVKLPLSESPMPEGQGANTLKLTVQAPSFGQKDLEAISQNLGLNAQEAQSNCTLYYTVMAMSASNKMGITFMRAPTWNFKFDGAMKDINFYPQYACKKLRPPKLGIVIDSGELYLVSIEPLTCTAPQHGATLTLNFRYLGNGQKQCAFQ